MPFIVNDRVDVALAAESDGAHVGHIGEEDLSPQDARRLLGPRAIVGVSVGTPQEAHTAASQGASYVSAGPMFVTSTKSNAGPAAARRCCGVCARRRGCRWSSSAASRPQRSAALFAAGADGVCVGRRHPACARPEAAARAFFERDLAESRRGYGE